MIKPLRNTHRHVWLILAILLPAGILLSWLVIPNPVPVKKTAATNVELLPLIQAKKETLQYCINIRSNADKTNWQLQWINRLPLAVPSAVIYNSLSDPGNGSVLKPGNAELVGRIEARGEYVFPLNPDLIHSHELHLVIYDFIHDKTLDFITFKTLRQLAD